MAFWFIIFVSACISAIASFLLNLSKQKLPPGPPSLPLIGNFIWLRRSVFELETVLRRLKIRYGPLITVTIGPRKLIFVAGHSLAHRALIHHGAVFSDRPPPLPTSKILNRTQKSINSAAYGPTWRLLRRNLTHEILHPTRVKSYSSSRRWVLSILIDRLLDASKAESSVKVIDHFQYAMFCLLALMCFGDKLGETQIKEIESVQRRLLVGFRRFYVLNLLPRLGKVVFRQRWKEFSQLRLEQEDVLVPLIRSRFQGKHQQRESNQQENDEAVVLAYVDTLVDLRLPEENRKLDESEMVSLCSEFLAAGTDTTATALQWIMANLVKHPDVQAKLRNEIIGVVGESNSKSRQPQMIEEEDLQEMPYLKAVVLEALRRHPPSHLVLPHKVTHDVKFEGYMIPRSATVNFLVAEMGWDPKVWEDPMSFKPERFSREVFDITGSSEIKMMPFGAGRRICPGLALALLHLEYFVANLIWKFEWIPEQGDHVDLTEKQEFTTVMKNPLRARITPRI